MFDDYADNRGLFDRLVPAGRFRGLAGAEDLGHGDHFGAGPSPASHELPRGGGLLEAEVRANFNGLVGHVEALEHLDPTGLAEVIQGIVIADNREARLAGVDADDRPLAPLAASTDRGRRGGNGPALAPHGAGSRAITGFGVEVRPGGDGEVLIRCSWEGAPFLAYHRDGDGRLPVRDVMGFRPQCVEEIRRAVAAWAGAAAAGR